MSKQIKLRAFTIESNNINQVASNIVENFSRAIENTYAKDRRLRLNSEDENQEEDLISDYDFRDLRLAIGSMLRIAPSNNVLNIPDDLFNDKTISIRELDRLQVNSDIIYKNHYYFAFSNKYLITNLGLNTTIIRFQTYINWLLRNFRGQTLYEFTPMVIVQPDIRMHEIKKIKVNDTSINPYVNDDNDEEGFLSRIKQIPIALLENLFNDTSSLHDAMSEDMISAELLVKFKKPRKVSVDDYQRTMGALFKPIAETENITVYPKNGSPINGKDLNRIKLVNIETLESGKISEEQLYQEMENFIIELDNE